MNSNLSLEAQLWVDVEELESRLKFAEKSNTGRNFAMLFVWKKIEQIAAKKYQELMQRLISDKVLHDPFNLTFAGNHVLGESGKYVVQVNVSVPRREFSADWLCQRMAEDYKVPVAITRQLLEQAKRPGNTQVRRVTVAEKGGPKS